MQFTMTVVALDRTTKPTKAGSYQQLEVAYKNLESGKLESKKLMSFVKPDSAYKTLNDAKIGDQFTITSLKKEGEQYWTWTEASPIAPGSPVTASTSASGAGTATTPRTSTYETPEERAKKQVFIIKQSCLAQAIAATSVGAKSPPSRSTILEEAQAYVDWVMGEKKVSVLDMPSDFGDIQVE